MLRDTIVPSQHTKTRRFLLPCGRPGPRFVWPWLPSAIQMATPTSGDGAAAQWYPTLPISPAFLVILPRGILLPVWSVFLRCDVFLSSNKITTFQVKVNFRGNAESVEYWVKWIGWFYCNLPASFSYHVKISRFLRFSSCLDVWQVQIPNKLGAQPDSVAIQRFQSHFLCLW